MKIACYPGTSAKNDGIPVMSTFIHSLINDGQDVREYANDHFDDTVRCAVIWSVLWQRAERKAIWQYYRSRNIPVIVLEVGCVERMTFWKVGLNGVNRTAQWANDTDIDLNRWQRYIVDTDRIKPWRPNPNGSILVCTQHELSEQWKGMPSMARWVIDTCLKIREHTNRHILIRHHPRFTTQILANTLPENCDLYKPRKLDHTYDDFDFDESLNSAWCVVNHSSNPAVEAVMKGIPVFCSQDNLAYDVGSDDLSLIETPRMPDRTEWSQKLIHTEWDLDEIRTGVPWKRLKKLID